MADAQNIDDIIENAVDEDEDVGVEVNEGAITKQGPVEISPPDKKSGSFKPVWIVLVQGTLFYYKDSKLKSMKGEVQLKGTSVEKTSDGLSIGGNKTKLKFASSGEQADWENALKNATSLGRGEAPSKLNIKSQGGGTKAKKAIAGKIATSGMGKGMVKTLINDESKNLIKSVKACVTAVFDKKTAEAVENDIIKLFVKAHFLAENGSIDPEWYVALDKDLRAAFDVSIRITDNVVSKRTIPEDTLKEWIGKVQLKFKSVEEKMYNLLKDHLQPKSLNRITEAFGVFTDFNFLRTILVDFNTNDKIKKDAESLQLQMERYNSIPW